MKLKFVLILALLAANGAFAQAPDCNCVTEFQYVKQKIEKNYSAFGDKIKMKTRKSYDSLVNRLEKLTPKATKPAYCLFLLQQYVDFFQDGHLYFTRKEENSQLPFSAKARAARKEPIPVPLSSKKVTYLKTSHGPEGIYWNPEHTMRIAVTESVNEFRNYVAQVMVSESNSWRKGDILMELNYDSTNFRFDGFEYTEDGMVTPVSLVSNSKYFGKYLREGAVADEERKEAPAKKFGWTSGRKLSDKTFYLRVASFEKGEARIIDSVVKANLEQIGACGNLILDLRGNGGGADFAFGPLSPLIYTDSIKVIGASLWATEDNINAWSDYLKMDLPADTKKWISEVIEKMKAGKNTMVPYAPDSYKKVTVAGPVPKKVVVLMDKGCASTTEEFILRAKQSRKTTLMGQNTGGVLDYANVVAVPFKTLPYLIEYPTSRSRRVDMGLGIDNIGIVPQIRLDDSRDWIAEAQLYLEKN